MTFSVHAFVRYPIGLTALQVAYALKDRCTHSYYETAPLVQEVYTQASQHNTLLAQASAVQVTLKEQLNNTEAKEKYVEAYRSIGGASAIIICSICFMFCKH